MYICEMIRQSNEIFCSAIRNWAVMLTVRGLSKTKTVPANFNFLCEGQKGHNIGRKGHFKDKRDKTQCFGRRVQKKRRLGKCGSP